MYDNMEYTEYNEEKNRIPWARVFLSLLVFIVAFFIVIVLLKACGKTSLKDDLLKAGKNYYEKYSSQLPTEVGECLTVNLTVLEQEGLIKKDKYATCDDEETYVRVCYLESKTYHYSAILACESEKINYGMWKDGTEADLTKDSDVRFKYLGEEKNTGTKYYYPSNSTNIETVKEYYASSPSTNYTGKEDEQTGYKWYVEKEEKTYWDNGSYSSTQPSGFTNKGESKTVTKISETKPSTASYRTISEATIYKKQNVARPYIYYCVASNTTVDRNNPTVGAIVSSKPCSGEYPKAALIEFTCDGKTSVEMTYEQLANKNYPSCGEWSSWTTEKCTESVTNGVKCQTKEGYVYKDTQWKWYKNTTVKSYYPSGKSSASQENTYYLEAPVSGAIKDTTTGTLVNKYYKLEKTNDESNFEEWLPVTEGYVDLQTLIDTFKSKNYDVESLKDINELEDIRYNYQLEYRNVEE